MAVDNEVKEVLFNLSEEEPVDLTISAILITKNSVKEFTYAYAEKPMGLAFEMPQQYLYEPNVAILKAGLQDRVGVDFELSKLHPNSHLYTSMQKKASYPGRVFKVESLLSTNKKQLRKEIPSGKANITVRNFPMNVATIRKKTGLKEGGEIYLFATTLKEGKKVLIKCRK
ncbi:MAG: hypothetical protein F6K11_35945 [Leptolyngbya sp. SIO3F4]|nr:hypothetical protein [Leptolyngbya sp. SIO3F4]